jgi:hypothetical protein
MGSPKTFAVQWTCETPDAHSVEERANRHGQRFVSVRVPPHAGVVLGGPGTIDWKDRVRRRYIR